jgi:hypothetical protein
MVLGWPTAKESVNCSSGLPPVPAISVDGITLKVEGIIVDRILTLSMVANVTKEMRDPISLKDGLLVAIQSWEQMVVGYFGVTSATFDVFCKTLFRGCRWWNGES